MILGETARRLEPNQLLSSLFTQLDPLGRYPRKLGRLLSRLEAGTLTVGIAPKDLGELDALLRTTVNRLGAALIVVGLLISSALMARVHDAVALAGFTLSGAIALYLIWRILRSPGEL